MGGIDTYTKLMLHMNGTDGSTTFVDSMGKTVFQYNHAQIDTAQSVFGGASALFDGTDDYIKVAANADFDMAGGEWCIDCRFRVPSVVHNVCMWAFNYGLPTISAWTMINGGTNKFMPDIKADDGTRWYDNTTFTIAPNVWYHLAIFRTGNSLKVALDGNVGVTWDVTGKTFTNIESQDLYIGQANAGGANCNCWIDEFRIQVGATDWTGNFTPPGSQYSANDYELSYSETLGLSDSPDAPGSEFYPSLSEDLGLSDAPFDGQEYDEALSEDLGLDDAEVEATEILPTLSETLGLSDALDAPGSEVNVSIAETLGLTQQLSPELQAALRRKREPVLATGRHITVRLRSNASPILLEDMACVLFHMPGRTHVDATQDLATGNHMRVRLQHNTASAVLYLEYMAAVLFPQFAR